MVALLSVQSCLCIALTDFLDVPIAGPSSLPQHGTHKSHMRPVLHQA